MFDVIAITAISALPLSFCVGKELRKFQEQYSKVVRNQASVTLKITKCTTIGPPRIGKTCFKNLLIGQEWDVEEGTASTDVMEAPEWVECYSLEEGGAEKPWKLLSAEQQQGELIRAVNSLTISNTQMTTSPGDATPSATPSEYVQLPTPSPTTTPTDASPSATSMNEPSTTTLRDAPLTTKPSDAPPTTESVDAPPTTTPSNAPPPTESVDAPPTTTSSNVQEPTRPTSSLPPPTKPAQKSATVLQALEALASACSSDALQDFLKDKQGKVLGETRLVHFIDTGGQAIYHDVHPVLITSPSVYLVVFSLSELCKKSPEERLAYFRSGLIQRPLRSIYTFGTKAPRKEDYVVLRSEVPKILVVGTHLDQVPLKDSGMERFLDDISRMIEKEISNKPYRQFVQYDTEGRSFWAVDNTLAGKEQSEGVKRYNTGLRRMVQEGSTEMSVKVPLPWMLLKLVMDSKGVRYCKYSELLEEARSRGYVREDSPGADLDTMLWLFHVLGLIYHKVPSECKKEDSLVFIDPDCLYSATSDFLMAAKEEIEDSSEEGQHQPQAASTEKHGEAVKSANTRPKLPSWRKLRTAREAVWRKLRMAREAVTRANIRPELPTERNLRPTREAVRRANTRPQAASTEETEDDQGGIEEGQQQTQAASTEETEDNQGGSEEGQHQTQAASTEEMFCDKEMARERGRQQKQEAKGIVQKRRVIERIQCNAGTIKSAIEAELQTAEQATKQEATEDVLTSLQDQLKKIEQQYKLPARYGQVDAASVKAKQQLYIHRMVKSLASSVKAVLGDAGRKGDVQRVRREVGEAVDSIRTHYQGRFIVSRDMDQVLSILSDLRIVAKLSGSDRYVVPAALPEVPHSLNISGSADPILVTVVSQTVMEVCFLPSGLFCCLISELVTKLGWTVEPLGRTHVAFIHKDLTGVVHVVEHESYIEIKLESTAPLEELPKTCQNVRDKIHKHIVDVYKTLYSDPTTDSAFEESLVWGFRCEEHPGDDTHIAAFVEDDYECCAECLLQDSGAVQLVTAAQRVWGLVTLL